MHTERVLCYNRDHSFELSREGVNSKWYVSSFDNSPTGKAKFENIAMFIYLHNYLNAPFSLLGWKVGSLLSEERFSVRSVSRVRDGDKQMLKVEFDRKPDSKGREGFHGSFIVSPDEAWVVRSFEYMDQYKHSGHGTVEYGAVQHGVPVPKRVVHNTQSGREGGPSLRGTYDFEEFTLEEAPDRDFTLAAFGIPDIGRSNERVGRSPVFWLLVLSFSAMAIAIALKTASSRFQRKKAMSGV
jgi:hypothetical protein